jgi:hypothetical protein
MKGCLLRAMGLAPTAKLKTQKTGRKHNAGAAN